MKRYHRLQGNDVTSGYPPPYACAVASIVSDSLWPYELQPTWLLCPRDCPAKMLEGVAISSSRGSSWPRDRTHVSCIVGGFFTTKPVGKPEPCYIITVIHFYVQETYSTSHTNKGNKKVKKSFPALSWQEISQFIMSKPQKNRLTKLVVHRWGCCHGIHVWEDHQAAAKPLLSHPYRHLWFHAYWATPGL